MCQILGRNLNKLFTIIGGKPKFSSQERDLPHSFETHQTYRQKLHLLHKGSYKSNLIIRFLIRNFMFNFSCNYSELFIRDKYSLLSITEVPSEKLKSFYLKAKLLLEQRSS